MTLTHAQLVLIGAEWLRKSAGCSTVLEELCAHTGSGEKPDVIGWHSGKTYLIECKTSRADFLRDAKKRFRIYPERGMGQYRYYLVPRGTLKESDLPARWGLLEVDADGVVRWVCGKVPRSYALAAQWEFHSRNLAGETAMLLSALSRAKRHMGDVVFRTAIHTPFPRPEQERREQERREILAHNRRALLRGWSKAAGPKEETP